MVNLHYQNLPDINYPVEWLIKRVSFSIGEYLNYIKFARELQWMSTRLERVKWKRASQSVVNGAGKSSSPDTTRALWVEIEEVGEREDVDVVDDFANADFVIEVPDSKAPKIKVLDSDANRGLLLLEREPRTTKFDTADTQDAAGPFLYLPPNDYVLQQQKRALFKLRDKPEPEHRGLIRLIEDSRSVRWPNVQVEEPRRWEFLSDDSVEGTDEQRRFVGIALATPDFAFLEGPPGSGKTMTICELIIQEIRRGHRILLCASTHVAVDNVLEFLQDHGATARDVLAVRIGDERRISERVKEFQLGNHAAKEAKDLVERLNRLASRTPAQQYLLDALQSSPDLSKSIISRIILESANLVCGTTVGILQHPYIKERREGTRDANGKSIQTEESVIKPFDLLIIDEASKTTFQEFLVPALFARRWILVGDVRQLSPYVEAIQIEDNLRGMIAESDDANVCLNVFQAWFGSRQSTQGIVVLDPSNSFNYVTQAEKLGLHPLDLTRSGEFHSSLEILGSHVILCNKEAFTKIHNLIPQDAIVYPPSAVTPLMKRRHDYWLQHNPWGVTDLPREDRLLDWASNIAWRLGRSFELRHDAEGTRRYDQEVYCLLPQWYGDERLSSIKLAIETIKRIALPSALELIQKGFGRRVNSSSGSCLTDGMAAADFSRRHIKLSYQHRMHPEISKIPREAVYDSDSLKDTRRIDRERSWSYERFKERAGWIQPVGGRSDARFRNEVEADIVMRELQAFLDWAAINRKGESGQHQGSWEVAILAFYRGQESLLRGRLRRLFGTNFRTEFRTNDGSAKIRLGTVDRFQGHEADLVIVSFSRTRGTGFLDSPNRLNVAITRARYQLLLVGNQRMFTNQRRDTLLKSLATRMPTLRVAWEDSR